MRPEFHPAAADELAAAAQIYQDRAEDLGRNFSARVKRVAAIGVLRVGTPEIGVYEAVTTRGGGCFLPCHGVCRLPRALAVHH